MAIKEIHFNTKGHDGFIDFIKAYAILCVLVGHTLPVLDEVGYGLWAGMQVPLFILVQTFHCYKKGKASIRIGKVLSRVMVPFLIFQIFTILLSSFFTGNSIPALFKGAISIGGYGPGSYFPWLYLQVAILLPLFAILLKRLGGAFLLLAFLIICEGFEVLFSIIDFPTWLYRLLAIRYLFLFYLGWIWVKDGIKFNGLTISLRYLA